MAKAVAKKQNSYIKQMVKHRTALEWVLFVLLLLLAIAFIMSRSDWWFWPDNNKLGTAFDTSRKVAAENPDSVAPIGTTGTAGNSGGTGTATRTGSNTTTTNNSTTTNNGGGGPSNGGSGGGGGGNGGGSSTPNPILALAADINTGDSKQDIAVKVNGLSQNCAVVADIPLVGRQEVCVYTSNGVTATVTYLNDRVLSASLSGM